MDNKSDWQERKYDEIFKKTCQFVENRKRNDENFSIKDLEEMIKLSYIRRGNDWVGKGPLKYIEDSAIIAAFEHKLAEWKKDMKKKVD